MEAAFSLGWRSKIGFPALLQQAGAGGEHRIERQTRLLQNHRSQKRDVEVRAGPETRRRACSRLPSHKKSGTRAARRREAELAIDLFRHHRLMIAVVDDERRPFRKFVASSDFSRCQVAAVSASLA